MEENDNDKPFVSLSDTYFYNEFYSTDTSFHKSLDLDAFFGYNKSKRKSIKTIENENFRPNRVFLSNVDTFNGKYISKFFAGRSLGDIGSSNAEGDEEEEKEEKEEGVEEEEEEGEDLKSSNDESEIKKDDKLGDKARDKMAKAAKDAEQFYENFIEYEYIDALYAKYDVSKLTVLEYGELLNLKTHEERLLYLEKKFGVLKKDYLVSEGTSTERESEKKKKKEKQQPTKYEIVTSVKKLSKKVFDNVNEVIEYDPENLPVFTNRLLKCGVFIFDLTLDPKEIDEARLVLNIILDTLAQMERQSKDFATMEINITLILLSSLLTWAATKPIDPEEPTLPFTEKDFKKRRAHPNYLQHIQFEKDFYAAGLKYKHKLKVYVIGVGVVYGYEEDVLHYLFRLAWLNEKELPVLGKGRNRIPLIHIDDLSMLLHLVISNPPKSKYLFAIEKPLSSLKAITKAVSKALGTGKIVKIPKESAFLNQEITQQNYELLTANLNVESNVLDEELNMKWRSEIGFVENIKAIEKDFRACRKLSAIKILVVGPPGSGKTTVSMRLSEYYSINYLTLHRATDSYIHDLKEKIRDAERKIAEKAKEEEEKTKAEENKGDEEEKGEEEEEEEEEEEDEEEEDNEQLIESCKEELKTVQQNLEDEGGKLSDELAVKVMKDRLLSRPCQNQGYILEGFPFSLDQTKALFGIGEGDEAEDDEEGAGDEEKAADEEEDAEMVKPNKKVIPDIVICLEASNDHLYRNLLKDPAVARRNLSEQEIYKNITKYRKMNTEENTLLIYFDQIEKYPHVINVEADKTPEKDKIVDKILSLVGRSCNYDSARQVESEKARSTQAAKRFYDLVTRKHKEVKKLRREIIRKKLEVWAFEVDKMKEEEEAILAKESLPLRHYLIKFVFPALTNGLIEVAKLKPDDPIDYLAEYLFKENHDGRMFVEDREEPTEIKKMINMLFNFKNYLHEITHVESEDLFAGIPSSSDEIAKEIGQRWRSKVRESGSSAASHDKS